MSLYHEWKKQLEDNIQQKTAFEKDTHTVVIAGPGSGKTRVLALKIAQLLHEKIDPPRGVACLTYTRIMAKELESRLYSLGITNRPNVVVSTVHGFCLGQVLIPFSDIYDFSLPKPIRVAPTSIRDTCLKRAYERAINDGNYKKFEKNFHKLRRQHVDKPLNHWRDHKEIAEAISSYEQCLIGQGFVDFDLIIQAALRLIISQDVVRQYLWARFPWLAVDEYQDLGYPLYRIVTELVNHTDIKLFAIGDPDQCIFDFAGTDPKYLVELSEREDMQPKIELQLNYRSKQEIIEVGQVLLGENRKHRSEKRGGRCHIIECANGLQQQAKVIVKLVKKYQNNGIRNDQIAVFHRYWKGLEEISMVLEQAQIDYVMDKNNLYDRRMVIIRWLEDLACWCLKGFAVENKLESNTRSTFDELLNTWLEFGISSKLGFNQETNHARIYLAEVLWNLRDPHQLFRDWLARIDDALDLSAVLNLYRDEYPDEADEYKHLLGMIAPNGPLHTISLSKFAISEPCIQLTTIHSSKGTEFEVVIIAGIEQVEKSKNGHRLLYVGATRAKSELCLLYTQHFPHPNARHVVRPQYITNLLSHARGKNWGFVQNKVVG
jgi:DNA helicase-2/ATP-dependent DNA helicase PcrA